MSPPLLSITLLHLKVQVRPRALAWSSLCRACALLHRAIGHVQSKNYIASVRRSSLYKNGEYDVKKTD
jgi:hypothetical protein